MPKPHAKPKHMQCYPNDSHIQPHPDQPHGLQPAQVEPQPSAYVLAGHISFFADPLGRSAGGNVGAVGGWGAEWEPRPDLCIGGGSPHPNQGGCNTVCAVRLRHCLASLTKHHQTSTKQRQTTPNQHQHHHTTHTTLSYNGMRHRSNHHPVPIQVIHPLAMQMGGDDGTGRVALGGLLCVVGGHDGSQLLDTAEAYDPQSRSWIPLPPMATARVGPGVVVL